MDTRWGKVEWGPNGTRVMASPATWRQPLKWNREAAKAGERRRVFCASLADIFEDWQGPITSPGLDGGIAAIDDERSRLLTMDDLRLRLFRLIDATPNLDWLILTKRPENVLRMWPVHNRACYRENVWLLTSVSDQATADRNIPELLKCRDLVPVLGVSAEPLLGPIDFGYIEVPPPDDDYMQAIIPLTGIDCVKGATFGALGSGEVEYRSPKAKMDWIIVGGESGKGARPCAFNWIASIQKQCRKGGVPVFVKQLGSNPTFSDDCNLDRCKSEFDRDRSKWCMTKDRKGADWNEWPADLRVRQYPVIQRHLL